MKKRILTMILSALLLTNVTACNVTENGTTGTSENTTTTTTEATTTTTATELENPPSNSNSTGNSSGKGEPEKPPKVVPEEVKEAAALNASLLGTTIKAEIADLSTLESCGSMGDAEILVDENSDYYAYVPAWESYFKMPLKPYEEACHASMIVRDALICNDTLWVMSFDWYQSITLTQKIAKDGEILESYCNTLHVQARSLIPHEDRWLFNCHLEHCFYIFFFDATSWLYPDESRFDHSYISSITTFVSIDGGKTWEEKEGEQAGTYCSSEHLEIAKFINNHVGIVSYRYISNEDGSKRIFLTTDGGATWSNSFGISYPQEGYNELVDLEYVNGQYVLTLKTQGGLLEQSYITTYASTDLASWYLVSKIYDPPDWVM